MTNAVVIEDEAQIASFISRSLKEQGFTVTIAENGTRGLIECNNRQPDIVLIDLGLPDLDGLEVITKLRQWSAVPIIVLSARTMEAAKIQALDAGADDYLTKPFSLAELLARVRAHLRRYLLAPDRAAAIMQLGEVEIDLAARTIKQGSRSISLSPIEWRLLTTLIRHVGKVVTHRQLLTEVWGPGHTEHHHYLRIYMGHLRQKLEQDPTQPRHIVTETGVGYRLVEEGVEV